MTENEKPLRQILKDKNRKRFNELKEKIRSNRPLHLPFWGDPLTALQMLTRERRSEENKRRALVDPLTELFNQGYYLHEIRRQLGRIRREQKLVEQGLGERVSETGFVRGDIRNFKRINDSWGHTTGDLVLASIGYSLLGVGVRETDSICRSGGDEITAILPDIKPHTDNKGLSTAKSGAASVALRMLYAVMGSSVDAKDETIKPYIDLGVTLTYPTDTGKSIDERADRASYLAKRKFMESDRKVVVITLDPRGNEIIEIAQLEQDQLGESHVKFELYV